MTVMQEKSKRRRAFLTAQWRQLAMLNYEIEPEKLEEFLPPGTELDFHEGKTYVSIVGFMFLKTRVLGLPVPGHRRFEEVNLRFYVRRKVGDEVRRGVTFIKEIAPRWAVEKVARAFYNENYVTLPMRHTFTGFEGNGTARPNVAYRWQVEGNWYGLELETEAKSAPPAKGSREEFIVEHYWGYGTGHAGRGLEYRVEHPPWNIYPATKANYECDIRKVYGEPFVDVLSRPADFAFLADGSEVEVYRPVRVG